MILYRELREAILSAGPRPDTLAGGALAPAILAELKEEPHLATLLQEIREEARRAVSEPVPPLSFADFSRFDAAGTRREYEQPYFERRGRLLALALAVLLDDADAGVYVEALENIIWDICGEYAWAIPAHLPDMRGMAPEGAVAPNRTVDLFAAETAHALAETLYLLGDRLHPWVASRIREEVERRVFRPLFERSTHFLWEAVTNNWAAVCGGAAGMAALLLIDDPVRLAGVQHRIVSAMESFLAGYGEDGCCPEGAGYWNYGFGYFVYWAEMLRDYTGGAVDLLQRDKIRRIAAFPAAVSLSGSLCVNYSDCQPAMIANTGLISRLCDRLGVSPPEMTAVPSFHADHCYRWPHQLRNLLWTNPKRMNVRSADRNWYFPSTAWLIAKRSAPGGLLAFSAKGGHNHEAHNHNDLGHFIVHAGGETLLADLGGGVYTREYFGEERYSFLHNGSQGHSVPLVNGLPQAPGERHRAAVVEVEAGQRVRVEPEAGRGAADTPVAPVVFELDLTAAYPEEAGLGAFFRRFEWRCDPTRGHAGLTLTDLFEFSGTGSAEDENSVTEHFISEYEPVVGAGEAVWRGERGMVSLRFDPARFRAAAEAIDTHRHDGSPMKVYLLRLHAERLPRQFECSFAIDCRLTS
ncbi:heparinase II/III family protein [Cohnella sp. 56]|uniref:heparinase II/III family protein n=1 Tax=Cohnella sp. 56 TaxID=3113722 RepID=UPI0030EAC37A